MKRATLILSILALLCAFAIAVHAAVTVTLAWDASPTTDIDGYRLQMVDANGNAVRNSEVPATQLQASMTDLVEGQTYSFVVRSYRGADQSDPSNLVTWLAPLPSPTPTPTPGPTATPTPQPLLPPSNAHVIGAQAQQAPKAGPSVSTPTTKATPTPTKK